MGLRGSPTLNFYKKLQRAKLINTWCSNYCLQKFCNNMNLLDLINKKYVGSKYSLFWGKGLIEVYMEDDSKKSLKSK